MSEPKMPVIIEVQGFLFVETTYRYGECMTILDSRFQGIVEHPKQRDVSKNPFKTWTSHSHRLAHWNLNRPPRHCKASYTIFWSAEEFDKILNLFKN